MPTFNDDFFPPADELKNEGKCKNTIRREKTVTKSFMTFIEEEMQKVINVFDLLNVKR